jgi:hypothetical protein
VVGLRASAEATLALTESPSRPGTVIVGLRAPHSIDGEPVEARNRRGS